MKNILLLAALMFSMRINSQTTLHREDDYTEYYQLVAQAENEMFKENFKRSLDLYELCFSKYDFVFAADALSACQIAAYLKKTPDFDSLLIRSFRQGVTLQMVHANPMIKVMMAGKDSSKYLGYFPAANRKYLSKLNLPLRNEWAIRYIKEQESKGKPAFGQIRDQNFARIVELLKQRLFPGEKLIGIPFRIAGSKSLANRNNDIQIDRNFAIPTLLHTYFPFTKIGSLLQAEILKGNISVWDFVDVYGAEQARIGTKYADREFDTIKLPKRYNNGLFGVECKDIVRVNRDRKELFMSDFISIDKRIAFAKKYHLALIH
jgi:hypothetical protein